ncbi:MAG: DMT family transporter [Treponemataceae bacterium]|nr:DMT family transporter [Treponemataceae bacterium]
MSDTSKGIFFIILSALFFALMALFVRLAGDIFFVQKAFFRNAVAFLIALVSILIDVRKNGRSSVAIPKGALLFLFLRSIAGTIGIFANFYAVDHLILSDAAILNKMAPFFTILFSFLLLKEKIRPLPLIAIICAFCGALLVVKPSLNFTQMVPTLAGLLGGIGAGFAYACVRKLSTLGCNGKLIVLFFSLFSMLASVPYMIFNFNPMTYQQWLFLLLSGVCAAGGQFTITAAYFHAPASKISIYDYSQIIFSAALGFFVFGQVPDLLSFAGYLIIIAMAVVNFVYNRKKN